MRLKANALSGKDTPQKSLGHEGFLLIQSCPDVGEVAVVGFGAEHALLDCPVHQGDIRLFYATSHPPVFQSGADLLSEVGLPRGPPVDALVHIVRGADTRQIEIVSQAAGLGGSELLQAYFLAYVEGRETRVLYQMSGVSGSNHDKGDLA